MVDMIRCPSCRGSKKVPKLGGMIGDCNTCKGKGEILESDRPAPVVIPICEPKMDIAQMVVDCVPGSVSTIETPVLSKSEITQTPSNDDKKRALYKRKKA